MMTDRRKQSASNESRRENDWPPYPPPGETELDKALRVEEEREAKRVSDAIDRALEVERQTLRRKKGETRLLLLGQSESGKSTMLKNFQMHFTPKAFHTERDAWRVVIHLNLVRSVNFILDVLSSSSASNAYYSTSHPSQSFGAAGGDISPLAADMSQHRTSQIAMSAGDIRRFKLALSPLRQVEMILAKQLAVHDVTAWERALELDRSLSASSLNIGRAPDSIVVRGGRGWKSLLRQRSQDSPRTNHQLEALDSARQILDACRADIAALWASETVRDGLQEEDVIVREQSGFFMDEAERIADINYEPTFDDILRARLQTIGAEEHRLIMETSAENGQQWVFYDVGGSRGQRASWVPFFDDVNAILFLCSTAGFNEVLLEDRAINRLLDSFNLWKTVSSSRLLANVQFVLLLNKTDILEARLKSGLQFSHYVKSYKDENDLYHVTEYLRKKFIAMHHHHSPKQRQLHVHCTCAINIDMTSAVLKHIRDVILVHYLVSTDML